MEALEELFEVTLEADEAVDDLDDLTELRLLELATLLALDELIGALELLLESSPAPPHAAKAKAIMEPAPIVLACDNADLM